MYRLLLPLFALPLFALPSCSGPPEPENGPHVEAHVEIDQDESNFLFAVVYDMSASMQDQAQEMDAFLLRNVQAFFRDQSDGRIVLSQISGSPNAILLDTNYREFRRRFKNPSEFRKFMKSGVHSSSRVFLSCAESLEWLNASHDRNPKLKSACIVISDFNDNWPDQEASRARLVAAIREYRKKSHPFLWFLGVGSHRFHEWEQTLNEIGFPHRIDPSFKIKDYTLTFN